MKAESTIRRELRRLRRIVDTTNTEKAGAEAYAMESALRWVLENCEWTPSGMAREWEEKE